MEPNDLAIKHWPTFAEEVLHLLSDEVLRLLTDIDRRTRLTDTHVTQMRKKLMAELQDLQDAVAALAAEDSVVISELEKLVALGDAVSAADVAAVTANVKAEVQRLADEVNKVDPPAPTV